MASSATSALGTSPRTSRWISTGTRTGRWPDAAPLLALLLLVLVGMTVVGVAGASSDPDRVDRSSRVLRGLDVVLADLTGAEAGRPGSRLPGQDDLLAASIAGREAIARGITELQATVEQGRSEGLQAVRAVVLQDAATPGTAPIRSLTAAVHAVEGNPGSARRAAPPSATEPAPSTSIAAGLVGLLVTAGAASVVGRGTTRDEVATTSRAPEPTTVSGAPSAGAEETASEATQVEVVSAMARQVELVALDATIEAARARDAGTSLAVVGAEVAGATHVPDLRTAVPAGSNAPRAATLVAPTGYAAARSRAHGPTTALWHAVELRRADGGIGGPCEIAVCGSLVRVSTEERWPVAARGVCPACATVAR